MDSVNPNKVFPKYTLYPNVPYSLYKFSDAFHVRVTVPLLTLAFNPLGADNFVSASPPELEG